MGATWRMRMLIHDMIIYGKRIVKRVHMPTSGNLSHYKDLVVESASNIL